MNSFYENDLEPKRLLTARRSRRGRCRRCLLTGGLIGPLLLDLAKLVENAALAFRRQRGGLPLRRGRPGRRATEDGMLSASKPSENRQAQARDEKQSRENGGRARQNIGLATSGHEAAAAADAERPALGTLQQHHRDKRDDDHKVYNDQNRLHRSETHISANRHEAGAGLFEEKSIAMPSGTQCRREGNGGGRTRNQPRRRSRRSDAGPQSTISRNSEATPRQAGTLASASRK